VWRYCRNRTPGLAAAEPERAVDGHGFVGGVIRPNKIGGRTVDHPDFDRLWETAQRLDVPIGLHEAYLSGIDTVGGRPHAELCRLPCRQPRLRSRTSSTGGE
jgi:predicted TIM-barrel fold metal-dependent hydrolase